MPTCPLASPDRPPIEAILFDLDDTLYRIEEIPERVRENIEGNFLPFFLARCFFHALMTFSTFDLFFLLLLLPLTIPFIPPFSLYHLAPSFHGRQAQDQSRGRP